MGFKQFIRRQIMGSAIFRRIEKVERRLDDMAAGGNTAPELNFARYCYLGGGVALVRLHDGHVLYVMAGEVPVVGSLLKFGRWTPHIEDLLRRLVRPGQTIVNVGAHVGYFSVILADLVGSTGRLLAVEPQEQLAELINRSLYLNEYSNRSEVICCALGPEEGSVRFAVREAWSSGGTVVAKVDTLGDDWLMREVRQRRLDDIVKERGMKPVDLILMDAEGYEPLVLDGCPEVLTTPSIRIIMEWSPELMSRHIPVKEFIARLHELGFRIWEIHGIRATRELSASDLLSVTHSDIFLSRRSSEESGAAPV